MHNQNETDPITKMIQGAKPYHDMRKNMVWCEFVFLRKFTDAQINSDPEARELAQAYEAIGDNPTPDDIATFNELCRAWQDKHRAK